MAATTLKDIFGQMLGKKGEAVRELNASLRAKGNLTEREDTTLRACMIITNLSYTVVASLVGFGTSLVAGQVHKFVGSRPVPRLLKIGASAGAGLIAGQMIILTKHSDEKSSVEAVRKHFYAEQVYSDQHQDNLSFRWIPRNLYVDCAYLESQKETEANNSADKAKTVSAETPVKNRSFGDLMKDPLACILGSTDSDMEDDDPPKRTATILRRRYLRARKRSHRRHHRHATL